MKTLFVYSADAAQNFKEFILGIGNKFIAEPLFDLKKKKI